MKHKKLQILVPQYKETEEMISFLLDSIEFQKEIDKKDIGVIICSDGGEYVLDKKFLKKYSYDIEYKICEHKGVSATRNAAFDLSDSDYVMYCDADDGFCSIFAIKIIFENIKRCEEVDKEPFDILSSKFYYEVCEKENKPWDLQLNDHNNTFIHGLIYRRKFLEDNGIRFKDYIWANEDSYFNITAGFYSKKTMKMDVPIYCWRENVNSVSNDPMFIMKTLHQLIHSNDCVIDEEYKLHKTDKEIATTTFDCICRSYLEMNKPSWRDPANKEYFDITMTTLKDFITRRGDMCKVLTDDEKKNILQIARNSPHYGCIENVTFNDFIKFVMNYTEKKEM